MKFYIFLSMLIFLKAPAQGVSFVFDDGWESVYTQAAPLLEQYGYTGAVSVIPEAVGTPEYMSWSQIRQLYDRGWAIWNHTLNHVDLSTLSPREASINILKAQAILQKRGMNPKVFVPPYGLLPEAHVKLISPCFKAIRMAWEAPEYKHPLYSSLEVKHGKIDIIKARLARDNHIILFMHKIEYTENMDYSITKEELSELLQFCYINKLKSIRIGDQ